MEEDEEEEDEEDEEEEAIADMIIFEVSINERARLLHGEMIVQSCGFWRLRRQPKIFFKEFWNSPLLLFPEFTRYHGALFFASN